MQRESWLGGKKVIGSITAEKLARVRTYLDANGFTSMVLMRKDNFSWITTGGNNCVIHPTSEGMCALVILPDKVYMIAQVMDGARIMDEDMNALQAEYIPLKWYEESILECAARLAGEKPISDIGGFGECRLADIYELHNPFFKLEIERMRQLGVIADEVMTSVALRLEPGMTDYEAEGMLLGEFARRGVRCDVALVGADERVFKYRHPSPCGKRIENYALLTPALSWKGLHCNIARTVCFGESVPEEAARAYEAVCAVAANNFSLLETGVSYERILEEHKAILSELGFANEWRGHYPGGRIGYYLCQSDLSLNPEKVIRDTDAFEWFITVAGAKTAELVVKDGTDVFLASNTGLWPSKTFKARNGREFSIPQILLRNK